MSKSEFLERMALLQERLEDVVIGSWRAVATETTDNDPMLASMLDNIANDIMTVESYLRAKLESK